MRLLWAGLRLGSSRRTHYLLGAGHVNQKTFAMTTSNERSVAAQLSFRAIDRVLGMRINIVKHCVRDGNAAHDPSDEKCKLAKHVA